MEIIKINDGFLSNVEVQELINERQEIRKKHNTSYNRDSNLSYQDRDGFRHRSFIEKAVLTYTKESPIKNWTSRDVGALLTRLKHNGFKFSEQELIVISNHVPDTDIEFYLMIESYSEKYTPEQLQLIKEIVGEIKQEISQRETLNTNVEQKIEDEAKTEENTESKIEEISEAKSEEVIEEKPKKKGRGRK